MLVRTLATVCDDLVARFSCHGSWAIHETGQHLHLHKQSMNAIGIPQAAEARSLHFTLNWFWYFHAPSESATHADPIRPNASLKP